MTKAEVVARLLDRAGRTYCDELGIDIASGSPSALFRLLCASILFSARIRATVAARAAAALADRGWTTAETIAAATWEARTEALNRAGYARYDESTSRYLGATAELLLREYGGDLRVLRERAREDPSEERRLLKQCKGLGDVGVDIFFREAQAVWEELYPFADAKARAAAARLGLGDDPEDLARLVRPEEFPRLIAALVRTALAKDFDAVAPDGG
jgi:hypothetical protein